MSVELTVSDSSGNVVGFVKRAPGGWVAWRLYGSAVRTFAGLYAGLDRASRVASQQDRAPDALLQLTAAQRAAYRALAIEAQPVFATRATASPLRALQRRGLACRREDGSWCAVTLSEDCC